MEEFARSFNNAMRCHHEFMRPVRPIDGVTAEALTEAIKRFGHKDVATRSLETRLTFADHVSAGRSRAYPGAGR